jgi:hypothetical protein
MARTCQDASSKPPRSVEGFACRPRGERAARPTGDVQGRPSITAWFGYAASAWAFLFAAVSVYWAAGGTAGIETQSASIQELGEQRDPWFVAVLWGTGILKAAGGLLGLALVQPWGRLFPRRFLLIAAWGAGLGMAIYGGLGILVDAFRIVGVIPIPEAADLATVLWHILLWDPWWLLGGILFVAAARHSQRPARNRSGGNQQ